MEMGLSCSLSGDDSSGGISDEPTGMDLDSDTIGMSWKQWTLKRKKRAKMSDFVCLLDPKTYQYISRSPEPSETAKTTKDGDTDMESNLAAVKATASASSSASDMSSAVSTTTAASAMSIPEPVEPPFTLFDFDETAKPGSKATMLTDPDELEVESPIEESSSVAIGPGPFSDCCWVIKDRLAFGALPESWDEIEGLMTSGITHIMCLVEFSNPMELYGRSVQDWLDRSAKSDIDRQRTVTLMHFPIHDFEISEHIPMLGLVQSLSHLLINDLSSVLYVHCLGGHGRSGTVSIHLMSALSARSRVIRERMSDYTGIRKYLKACHDHGRNSRYCGRYCRIPESRNQREQCELLRQFLCPDLAT